MEKAFKTPFEVANDCSDDIIDILTHGYLTYDTAKEIMLEIHLLYPDKIIRIKATASHLCCGFVPNN